MASVEQDCDTPDEQEEEKLKPKEVQMSSSGVCVNMNAQTGGTVNAPVLTGNTIKSLTINYSTAGTTAEKHTEKQDKKKSSAGTDVSADLNHSDFSSSSESFKQATSYSSTSSSLSSSSSSSSSSSDYYERKKAKKRNKYKKKKNQKGKKKKEKMRKERAFLKRGKGRT
ncbi:hypothetical protein Q8A67_006397 [Cirrhinus molitorella]|uniref:Uncharacterized protein n=1 Tax=Cirrhinus molitorella TaxID=172907 RepID=A0AA88Q512_9TELE|nr:hypothetical protein Q8A67_006397 [Cirrhinus molitorella]